MVFLFLAKHCSYTLNEKQGLRYFWWVPSLVQVWNLQKYLSNKLFLQKHESIPLRKKLWDRYSMRVKIWASVAAWTGFNLSLEGPFSRGGPWWAHLAVSMPCLASPWLWGAPWLASDQCSRRDFAWLLRLCHKKGSWLPREAIYHDGHAVRKQHSPVGGFLGLGSAPCCGAKCVSEAPSSMSSPVGPSDDSNSSYHKFRLQLLERSTIKISQQIQLARET